MGKKPGDGKPSYYWSDRFESLTQEHLRPDWAVGTRHIICSFIALYWTAATFGEFAQVYRPDEHMLPWMSMLAGVVCYLGLWLLLSGRRKFILFGLVVIAAYLYIKGCILHGTYSRLWATDYSFDQFKQDTTCVIASIPQNTERLQGVKQRAARVGLDCQVYFGEDASKFASLKDISPEIKDISPAHAKEVRRIANTVMMRQLFEKFINIKTKWLLFFEDDAGFLGDFPTEVATVSKYYGDADVIWLDARNALAWTFLYGRVVGGVTGTLFSKNSLQVLRQKFLFDDPLFEEFRKIEPGMEGIQCDAWLAYLCNHGVVKCAFAPLVAEVCGAESTFQRMALRKAA